MMAVFNSFYDKTIFSMTFIKLLSDIILSLGMTSNFEIHKDARLPDKVSLL